MTPWQRAIRTLLQVVVAGGFTALIDQIVHGLPAATAGLVLGVWTVIVTFAHNSLEAAGLVPALLGARHTEQAGN